MRRKRSLWITFRFFFGSTDIILCMITKRQKQIFDFIVFFESKKDFSPSLKEIKNHFKLSSESTVHQHLEALKKKGYLDKNKNQPRGIELSELEKFIYIPLVGKIAAGQPIEAIEFPSESIAVSKNEIRNEGQHYALRVVGDSMIGEGIFNGDTVIIRKQESADDGQTIVAIIDDNLATLKKIYREKNRIRLQPANPTLFPIYREEVEVRGVVIKVIRSLESTAKNVDKNIPTPYITEKDELFSQKDYDLNKIYNLDCPEFMRNVKDNSIDLIFADPPYNLSKSNFKMKFSKTGGADLSTDKGAWDKLSKDEFEVFTEKWLKESFRILKKTGSIWVAGTYHNIHLTGYLLEKIGFEILNEILWHKTDATPNLSCTRFVADHENFLWARKDKKNVFNYEDVKRINGGKQMRSIWPRGKTAGGKRVHPTQKPEWLLERIILATSKKNAVVFDPFLGSGTTAVVAKKLGRQYLGTELDRDYFKIAEARINNTTCNSIT